MFMCDITKTPPYGRYFVYSELLFANSDISIRFSGKEENAVLQSWLDDELPGYGLFSWEPGLVALGG